MSVESIAVVAEHAHRYGRWRAKGIEFDYTKLFEHSRRTMEEFGYSLEAS